jgi:hypothetical protein
MEKQVYKCECGYTTHFEKALTAHCRFRHHHPADDVQEEQKPKVKKTVKKTEAKKTTVRKPRTKKAENKE